jgi:hypothetical protein
MSILHDSTIEGTVASISLLVCTATEKSSSHQNRIALLPLALKADMACPHHPLRSAMAWLIREL